MRVAIMQPYFLPYIGYFQLMSAVDVFVIYDEVEFTKKGWINRNRILMNGAPEMVSLPLRKDSDYLDIVQRKLSDDFNEQSAKLLRKIEGCYKKAPFFDETYKLLEEILNYKSYNLFDFLHHSIAIVSREIGLNTRLVVSSEIEGTKPDLTGQDRVINLCRLIGASEYINPIGGLSLYSKAEFEANGIKLMFHKIQPLEYQQFNNEFVPHLSILDNMMFQNKLELTQSLEKFELL
jgi:hypothetical protein